MKAKLSAECRKQLRKLKRADVEHTLAKTKPHLAQARWLGLQNRYAVNTTERLPKSGAPLKEPAHLAQYIAASSLLHCADGWSYLGRALRCLLENDPHRAVHLAYYAELRAALSILAAEGIGVFKRRHFIIDGPNSATQLKARFSTHEFTWLCFNYWATTKNSGTLFSSVVMPGGIAISEWFGGVAGVEAHLQPQAKAWFRQWSMDLRQIDFDHDARNESSYRPDGIPSSWYVEGSESLKVAEAVWTACEPSPGSTFEAIDRHVLRHSVHRAFLGLKGKQSLDAPEEFGDFVRQMVNRMGFSLPVQKLWQEFLFLQPASDVLAIFKYSAEDASNKAVGFAAIIARATFLLRLSSGSALRLVRGAGIGTPDMKFWWNNLGVQRGFSDIELDGANLLSLWDDVAPLLENIREFQNAMPRAQQTYYNIRAKLPDMMASLATNERVAVWSMTP